MSTRSVALGIVIVLFIQSLGALLHPTKGRIKWGLVVHAAAMFSSLTISITVILNQLSISFVDRRNAIFILDSSGKSPPFQVLSSTPTTNLISGLMFPLNQWLADGLLVIYDKDPVTLVFDVVSPPAVSVLCYLRHELLGHSLPRLRISRYCWYASISSQRRRWHPQLTSFGQRWVVCTSIDSLSQRMDPPGTSSPRGSRTQPYRHTFRYLLRSTPSSPS